jgi:urease accessory protein
MIGMFVVATPWPSITFVSFLVLGGLMASNAKISLPVLTGVPSTIGVFHGYLNGTGPNWFHDGTHALVGMALAVCVLIAIFTSFVIPLRCQWALIVIRVAGSWIAASGQRPADARVGSAPTQLVLRLGTGSS